MAMVVAPDIIIWDEITTEEHTQSQNNIPLSKSPHYDVKRGLPGPDGLS